HAGTVVPPGESDHARQAFGVEQVVRMQGLPVPAVGGNFFERPIPVLDHRNRPLVGEYPDASIGARVFLGDVTRFVAAGVVKDDVLEVAVTLGEHAFDALTQVLSAVVDRRYDAYERHGEHADKSDDLLIAN